VKLQAATDTIVARVARGRQAADATLYKLLQTRQWRGLRGGDGLQMQLCAGASSRRGVHRQCVEGAPRA
jgi:hypothetical protein